MKPLLGIVHRPGFDIEKLIRSGRSYNYPFAALVGVALVAYFTYNTLFCGEELWQTQDFPKARSLQFVLAKINEHAGGDFVHLIHRRFVWPEGFMLSDPKAKKSWPFEGAE